MRVKFWGVRGSIPTPLTTEQLNEKLFQAVSGAANVNLSDPVEVQAYLASLPPAVRSIVGGNTTCVEIDTGTETIIIDGGSGMRQLGLSLMAREFGRGKGVAHIFLTHAHWDHLQGYPFFTPAYVPGNKLIFYAVNYDPQRYLEHQQVAPMYFPIPPNAMPAEKHYVKLREGEAVQIGRTVVTSLALYHPGTAYAYRFEDGESIFVFASDSEYKSLTEASLRHYLDFFANADVLVFDSQYSLRDVFLSKADWGHSSAIIGVDIAERARVKKLVTFHHDPTHSDEQIYAIAAAAREYALVNGIFPDTEVLVGYEGLELFLGQPMTLEVTETREDEVWTLALSGQLNGTTVTQAADRLRAALAEAPEGRVILDLTLVAAADAIGLKSLLDAARANPQAHLAVMAPGATIRRALDHAGASEAFKLFRSRQQALMALTGPAHLRLATEVIGGQYQIDELLFADDQGVVYRGTDRRSDSPIAVRVIAGRAKHPGRADFTAQVADWNQLSHPSLLKVKAVIEDEDWAGFVFPRPDALSLREWLAGRPAWTDIWHMVEQLCEIAANLHAQGGIHGDLRPENILISSMKAQVARAPLFPPSSEYGTNAYHAPEQLRGQRATPASDVYSLGIVLYELLLSGHPFSAESEELRLTLQLYSQPQSPRLRWPEIPAALEAMLMKMLALAPDERFPNAHAVLEALTAVGFEPTADNAPLRKPPS